MACEVCEFDFAQVYGELGYGFAECHHLVPLSELGESRRVRLADLAIVCANCHHIFITVRAF
ncbi:MAG: HNH endonuclease [Anaerolineales bacterium]|nr:HNH endonuclease [Anaerolineales bacterium]